MYISMLYIYLSKIYISVGSIYNNNIYIIKKTP